MPTNMNLALQARIIRRLVPGTARADIYAQGGEFLDSSHGVESAAVSAVVARQAARLRRSGPAVVGSQHMAGDHCVTLLLIRNAALAASGVLVLHHRKESGRVPPGTPAQLARAAAPALQLLAAQELRTGAPSLLDRSQFEQQAGALLDGSGTTPRCLVYGNIDRLHLFNERLGLGRADTLLGEVTRLWRDASARIGALSCHISGDRYVALLRDPESRAHLGRRTAGEHRGAAAACGLRRPRPELQSWRRARPARINPAADSGRSRSCLQGGQGSRPRSRGVVRSRRCQPGAAP
jgi:GGDEF domain-containing protein